MSSDASPPSSPCGGCRQVMLEFAADPAAVHRDRREPAGRAPLLDARRADPVRLQRPRAAKPPAHARTRARVSDNSGPIKPRPALGHPRRETRRRASESACSHCSSGTGVERDVVPDHGARVPLLVRRRRRRRGGGGERRGVRRLRGHRAGVGGGGPPIAAPERLAEVSARSSRRRRARRGGGPACSGPRSGSARRRAWPAPRIGEQPLAAGRLGRGARGRRSLREQPRRARAKGVAVRALAARGAGAGARHAAPARGADRALARAAARSRRWASSCRWICSRSRERRRLFVAELAGRVVGVLGVIPIYARGGWFFEDFLRDPAAPNGTIELLVDARHARGRRRGGRGRDAGLAPLAGEVGPSCARRASWSRALRLRGAARVQGQARAAQLEPDLPVVPAGPKLGARAVARHAHGVARGGLLRLGLQTLRGPAVLIRPRGAARVWTCVLALPWAAPWFPSRSGSTAGSPSTRSAARCSASPAAGASRWPIIVASAVTADAAITLIEALAYNGGCGRAAPSTSPPSPSPCSPPPSRQSSCGTRESTARPETGASEYEAGASPRGRACLHMAAGAPSVGGNRHRNRPPHSRDTPSPRRFRR